jgi:hypothetical protein
MKKLFPSFSLAFLSASLCADAQPPEERASYQNIQVQYLKSDSLDSTRIWLQSQFDQTNWFVDVQIAWGQGKDALGQAKFTGEYIDLGYKFKIGLGDLDVMFGYAQQQLKGVLANGFGSNVVSGIAWRQRINSSWEYMLLYQHWSGAFTFPIFKVTHNVDGFYGDLRYRFWDNYNLNIGYQNARTTNAGSESTWFVGLGCSF